MRRSLLATLVFFSFFLAHTTEAETFLTNPPQDIGFVLTGWNWYNLDGSTSGFTMVATTTFTLNTLTMWECIRNGDGGQITVAHVYKGPLDQLVEIATSSPHRFPVICPPNINQASYLVTQDDFRGEPYKFPQGITLQSGERLTITFQQLVPVVGYVQFGARYARMDADFVGRINDTTVISPPTVFLPAHPYYPAFELGTTKCIENCNSNVLFLPGLMGSRLFEESPACGIFNDEKERWVSKLDCDQARLVLGENGKSINPLYTKEGDEGVIDDAYSFNMYQSFMHDLDRWKNDEHIIADYALVPYDWRLSLEDILQNGAVSFDGKLSYSTSQGFFNSYIYNKLSELAQSSRTGKVTIVAHSNGGLVTKALIQKLKEQNDPLYDKIDNVIFVAVPQTGTPEAISNILHGDQIGPIGFVMEAKRLRNLTQNMPGAYHLLPSQAYFSGEGASVPTPVVKFQDGAATAPFISAYGDSITSMSEFTRFLLGEEGRTAPLYNDLDNPSILRPNLLSYAGDIHQQIDDNWEPSGTTNIYQIAGWGEMTLASIDYRSVRDCKRTDLVHIQGRANLHCAEWGSKLTFDPNKIIDGDGTVVMPSALAMSTSSERVIRYWVDLQDYNKVLSGNIDRVHKDILEIFELRNLLKNIVSQAVDTPQRYIFKSMPLDDKNNPRLDFILHSPLTLEFTDTEGRHIGQSTSTPDEVDFNVPGARYERYGEVQLLSIPKTATGTLMLRGIASGSFTLDIKEENGNSTISTTSFEGIPSATNTVVTMNIDPAFSPTESGTLVIDADGDGTSDLTLAASKDNVVLPPKFSLTVTADNKTMILGASLPLLTTTISGFLGGDMASTNVAGAPSCTTTATIASPVGAYPITCTLGTLFSETHDFTFATGTLTILYKWPGFSQPINDTTLSSNQAQSVFRGGSTVPVKFQIKNTNGTSVQSSISPIWLTPQKLSAMSASIDESTYSYPETSGLAFKWDDMSQQYVYNWSTKGLTTGYWYRINAKLEDGTTQSVVVGIR